MAERSLWGTRAFHLRHTLTTFNWLAAERARRNAGVKTRSGGKEFWKLVGFFLHQVVYAQLNQGGQRWVWGDAAGLIWTIRSRVMLVPEGMRGPVSAPSLIIKSSSHPPPPRRRAVCFPIAGLGHNVCLISMTRRLKVLESNDHKTRARVDAKISAAAKRLKSWQLNNWFETAQENTKRNLKTQLCVRYFPGHTIWNDSFLRKAQAYF